MFPFAVGPMEIAVIAALLLLLFGAGRIPKIMGGLGRGMMNFRREIDAPDRPALPPGEEDG